MITLRDWAATTIEVIYPPSLTPLATTHTPNKNAAFIYAVDALALACQCGVPSILPAISYCLSTIRWRYNEDGGRGHRIMNPVDMRRTIVGRELLQDASIRLATIMSLPRSLLPSTLVKSLAQSGQSRLPSIPVLERFCVNFLTTTTPSSFPKLTCSGRLASADIRLSSKLCHCAEWTWMLLFWVHRDGPDFR